VPIFHGVPNLMDPLACLGIARQREWSDVVWTVAALAFRLHDARNIARIRVFGVRGGGNKKGGYG
jgi:hypothetical protein